MSDQLTPGLDIVLLQNSWPCNDKQRKSGGISHGLRALVLVLLVFTVFSVVSTLSPGLPVFAGCITTRPVFAPLSSWHDVNAARSHFYVYLAHSSVSGNAFLLCKLCYCLEKLTSVW